MKCRARGSLRRHRLGGALAVALWLASAAARAQTPAEERGGAREAPAESGAAESDEVDPTAEVILIGEVGRTPGLIALLDELLVANGVEPQFRSVPRLSERDLLSAKEGGGQRVRIGVTLANDKRARLYLAEVELGRFMVRDVPLPQGLDEVGREGLAQVVASSTRALLESSAAMSLREMQETLRRDLEREAEPERPPPTRPPSRERPTPPPRESRPPPAERAKYRFELGVGYSSQWTGPDLGLLHGPGARLGIERSGGGGAWFATLDFMQGFEQEYESSELVVEVQTSTLRLLAGGGVELGPSMLLAAALGAGADVQRVTPRAVPGGLSMLETPIDDVTPWARLELGPRWRFSPLSAFVSVVGDLSPSRTHYDVRDATGERALFAPWRVRPGLLLGVGWRGDVE